MIHDVFISYPSKNKSIADAICAKLESNNIRCWFAPRDILPGQDYAKALVDAIDSSKIFVLVFSEATNNSPHIMSEVREAFNNNIIIIPFRIDDIKPSKSLEFFIGAPHWLDALTPPLEQHIDGLVTVVQKNLNIKTKDLLSPPLHQQNTPPAVQKKQDIKTKEVLSSPPGQQTPSTSGTDAHKSYKKTAGFWAGLLIIGLLVSGGIFFLSNNPVAKIIQQEAMKISQEIQTPANSPVIEVTRLNSTTVKLVYQGGKYKNLLNSIEWFYCMLYTKPHGEDIGVCNYVYMGDSNSTTPLEIGSTTYLENTESKINIRGTGHFIYGSDVVDVYDEDNV